MDEINQSNETEMSDGKHRNQVLLDQVISKYRSPLDKISIRFKAIGRARILKSQIFRISAHERFATVETFLRSHLGLKESDELVYHARDIDDKFIYVNNSFIPGPDETLGNLFTVCSKVYSNDSASESMDI